MTSQNLDSKVRLSVDCTEEERKYIKILAARNGVTISEYLLAYARQDMPKSLPKCRKEKCAKSHSPNATTKKALKASRQESFTIYKSLEDFWAAVGIHP